MKNLGFAIFLLLASAAGYSQYSQGDSNRIGIGVGVNQFSLATDNFSTSPGMGWNAGLSVRGNFYNNFDMIYGIQFSENNFTVATTNAALNQEDVNYKLSSAQISLLLSYKIVRHYLSVEVGPMFQINGDLSIDEGDEANIISGTTLMARDIKEINGFSFYPTIGITGGVKHFRLNVMYQYGLTNVLGKLNDQEIGGDFKGHASILSASLLIYL